MTQGFLHLPLAQSGLSFLIYLVVGIFWLVGNLMQQKQAKEKAEEMRRRREEREREEERTGKKQRKPHPLEDDLETFLGRRAGETPNRPEPTPPPLPRRPQASEPDIVFDPPKPPPGRRAVQDPPKVKPKTDIGSIALADSYEEMEELKDAVELSYEQTEGQVRQQALDTVHQVMIDLSPTTLNMPRLPVQRMQTVRTRTTPPNLYNRQAFKQAVVARVILDPPAALREPGSDGR